VFDRLARAHRKSTLHLEDLPKRREAKATESPPNVRIRWRTHSEAPETVQRAERAR